jgi:predicted PurR-regulated permease PerM
MAEKQTNENSVKFNNFSRWFLIFLVIAALAATLYIFKPFLVDIAIAAVLVTIFYKYYLKLTKFLKGHRRTASFLMCLILLVIIILPTINLLIYTANKSVLAYNEAVVYFENNSFSQVLNHPVVERLNLSHFFSDIQDNNLLNDTMLDFLKGFSNTLITAAKSLVVGTTNFFVSLVVVIFAMYFFFIDGKKLVNYLTYLLPLKEKYTEEIFKKFHEISSTTIISTFAAAFAQGTVGAIGFGIVGFPAFLAGIIIAFLSLVPVLGSALFYVPVGLYYLLMGQVWQGIFVILWGFFIIGTVDNVVRGLMIKDKAQINPIFVILSILGGIAVFGFWGVVLGPLVVSLLVTILHIYSLEFATELKSENKNQDFPPQESTRLDNPLLSDFLDYLMKTPKNDRENKRLKKVEEKEDQKAESESKDN